MPGGVFSQRLQFCRVSRSGAANSRTSPVGLCTPGSESGCAARIGAPHLLRSLSLCACSLNPIPHG